MTKGRDWDEEARRARAQRHGSSYAYDELPKTGSRADQKRYFEEPLPTSKRSGPTEIAAADRGGHVPSTPKKKARKLETCNGCGANVRNLAKHKSKCPARYGDAVRNPGDRQVRESLRKTNSERHPGALAEALKPIREQIKSKGSVEIGTTR